MQFFLTIRANASGYKTFILGLLFTAMCASAAYADDSTETQNFRQIRILQVPAPTLNFQFPSFEAFWITSPQEWQNFWKENSRTVGDAPELGVDWQSQSLLALFWPGGSGNVQVPSFQGTDEMKSATTGGSKLRLHFNLNQPCSASGITDQSPAQFLVMDSGMQDVDAVSIRTETTKSLGCY